MVDEAQEYQRQLDLDIQEVIARVLAERWSKEAGTYTLSTSYYFTSVMQAPGVIAKVTVEWVPEEMSTGGSTEAEESSSGQD